MNLSALKSIVRLLALAGQFSSTPPAQAKARRAIAAFLSEYATPQEAEGLLGIFDYHRRAYAQRELTVQRQSLLSVKITIIGSELAHTLSRTERVYLLIVLAHTLLWSGEGHPMALDLVRTLGLILHVPAGEVQNAIAFIGGGQPAHAQALLTVSGRQGPNTLHRPGLGGEVRVMHSPWAHGLFFVFHEPDQLILRNGVQVEPHAVYPLTSGGVIENYMTFPIHYSDLIGRFHTDGPPPITLAWSGISYRFPDGGVGLSPLWATVRSGQMVGVMGSSGAGKTTLLHLLAGNLRPTTGSIRVNGHPIEALEAHYRALVGFIPQDDQLVRELTVFQNLYLTARLCFGAHSPMDSKRLCLQMLERMGLDEVRQLPVGTPEKSVISGGQRKRLNLSLELIRQPPILLVDEPTSGLSSADSERIIEIIKRQTQRGALAVVNIHQPSSAIFRMFDRLLILDQGGRAVFFGPPLDSLPHFRTATQRTGAGERECTACGNVNPEQVLDIIEQKQVKADGSPSEQRRVEAQEWYQHYLDSLADLPPPPAPQPLAHAPGGPAGRMRQLAIHLRRNWLGFAADRQFVLLTILQAPLMALILAYISKAHGHPASPAHYSFFHNPNIPAYLLMALVVAMFMGLMFGAERLVRDRGLVEREKFIGLSRSIYLNAKLVCLLAVGAVQVGLFVLVGNWILGIHGMGLYMFLLLLSMNFNAGMLALNLSAGLRTTVAIYISIPILLIPQLILNGSLIPFDRFPPGLSSPGHVPMVANAAISRWGYEALLVHQFTSNPIHRELHPIDMQISRLRFAHSYLVPEVEQLAKRIARQGPEGRGPLLLDGVEQLGSWPGLRGLALQVIHGAPTDENPLRAELRGYQQRLAEELAQLHDRRDARVRALAQRWGGPQGLIDTRKRYTNQAIDDLVLARTRAEKISVHGNRFHSHFEPIHRLPQSAVGNAHFLSPYKRLGPYFIPTQWFNLLIIWAITLLLYISLYYSWLKKLTRFLRV